MKSLYNMFLDAISETKLFEQAFKRKDLLKKLQNESDMIVLHLIKIAILKHTHSDTVDHWKREISSVFSNKLKADTKSGNLKHNDFYENLYDTPHTDSKGLISLMTLGMFRNLIEDDYEESDLFLTDSYINDTNFIKRLSKHLETFYNEASNVMIDKSKRLSIRSYILDLLNNFESNF
ncbi:gp39 [Sphingomonas phage PAU]|uniref:gp39 n=1 Tax=Sphingomonas phage PAU TaxID=1150991 RepID=UPI000257312C|nr:gp39 [Sphingomonas phage PAU]AFF28037.1 gp39 [Sphingomonas phage PAU]